MVGRSFQARGLSSGQVCSYGADATLRAVTESRFLLCGTCCSSARPRCGLSSVRSAPTCASAVARRRGSDSTRLYGQSRHDRRAGTIPSHLRGEGLVDRSRTRWTHTLGGDDFCRVPAGPNNLRRTRSACLGRSSIGRDTASGAAQVYNPVDGSSEQGQTIED
jgi:hypothetical protein